MLCLLDELCVDVRNIIHRYLIDCKYTQLKKDYVVKWLSGSPDGGVYWNRNENMFSCERNPEANWRELTLNVFKSVYRFRMLNGDMCEIAKLPNRYVYTLGILNTRCEDDESDE